MHMAWLRHVGGRLKSDYRYSSGLVYNTFPTPPGSSDLSRLEPLAQAVLDARAAHSDSTLADLYNPNLMRSDLRKPTTLLTAPSISFTAEAGSYPNARGSSTSSCSMRK